MVIADCILQIADFVLHNIATCDLRRATLRFAFYIL